MDVLLLCSGNICRSPMAEALFRDRLRRRGVDARVHSAGLLEDGRPASEHSVAVLQTRGIVLDGHRSRRLTRDLLRDADLVVGMAREHVREAVVLEPDVWPRTYTLKELARRAQTVGPRARGQAIDEWIASCHEGRTHSDLLGDNHADDVADPYGAPIARYERTLAELEDYVDRVVDLAFPHDPPTETP